MKYVGNLKQKEKLMNNFMLSLAGGDVNLEKNPIPSNFFYYHDSCYDMYCTVLTIKNIHLDDGIKEICNNKQSFNIITKTMKIMSCANDANANDDNVVVAIPIVLDTMNSDYVCAIITKDILLEQEM